MIKPEQTETGIVDIRGLAKHLGLNYYYMKKILDIVKPPETKILKSKRLHFEIETFLKSIDGKKDIIKLITFYSNKIIASKKSLTLSQKIKRNAKIKKTLDKQIAD